MAEGDEDGPKITNKYVRNKPKDDKSDLALAGDIYHLGKHVLDKFTSKEFPNHSDDKAAPAKQYRLIAIPTPDTKFVLGQHVTQPGQALIGGAFGYPGISMETVENFYASIAKNSVFQSKGPVTFQTGEKWTHLSKESTHSSKERVTFTSGKMFIIAAGPEAEWEEVGVTGAELKTPTLNTADLHKQLVLQYAAFTKFSQASTLSFSELNVKVGLPKMTLGKLSLLQAVGLWLASATALVQGYRDKIEKVTKKLKAAGKQVESAEKGAKKAIEGMHKAKEFVEGHRSGAGPQGSGGKHTKPTAEGGGSGEGEGGGGAAGGEGATQTVEWDKKQVSELIKTAESATDDAEKGVKDVKESYEKAQKASDDMEAKTGKAIDLVKDGAYEKAFEASFGVAQAGIKTVMAAVSVVDTALASVQAVMANAAFKLLYDDSKPRLVLTADKGIDAQTDGNFHSYAAKGYDFFADEGGFMVHADKDLVLRSRASGDIVADKHLLIRANKGAELAAHGSVFLGSRTKNAEMLGKDVYVGAITPSSSKRSADAGDLGGSWTASTQQPTKSVRVEAEQKIVSTSKDQQIHVADKAIVISVGVYKVVVNEKQIIIGHAEGPQEAKEGEGKLEVKPPKDHLVEINARGITINKVNSFFHVVEDHITLGPEKSPKSNIFDVNTSTKNVKTTCNEMTIKADSKVTLKGSKVLIG